MSGYHPNINAKNRIRIDIFLFNC